MARLLMVFVVMSIVTGTISIYFSDCPDSVRKVTEGNEHPSFNCKGISSPLSVINWTLVPDAGSTRQLAVCYDEFNCTLYVDGNKGSVGKYRFSSSIQINGVPPSFSGTLQCSEVGDNTVETASCRVDVVRVRLASGDIRENGSGVYICYHAEYSPYTVTWTLTTDAGRSLHLGTCDETKQCTSPLDPVVQLRGYTSASRAYFNSVQRNMSGELFCAYSYDGFTETDQRLLNIYHLGTVDNCHVDITSLNWSAVLNCDVSQMFSSSGIYEFEIYNEFIMPDTTDFYFDPCYHYYGLYHHYGLHRQLTGRLSFRHDLSPYINHTDNKQYYRGRLSHSWKLSSDPSINLQFRLNVYYGTDIRTTQYIDKVFRIAKPTRPRHNCSDSSYVPEHEVLPCMCTVDNLGLPSGRLIWLLGDTVITTGAYGASQILLPSTAVTRRQEPMLVVCMLDWIEPLNATFLWNVAYGPDSVDLQVSYFYDVTDTAHVLITCHVSDLKPVSSSTVQWTGPCQGQAGFRCTVPLSVAEGQEVQCLVTNHANKGQSSEAVTVIKQRGTVSSQTQATQTQADTSGFKWATYAFGAALGIVAVVLFIVVMFFLRRRGHLSKIKCTCCGPVYDTPEGKRPQRNQSGDSTDLHVYEVVSNPTATGNESEAMSSGPVYENSLAEQEEHI